MKRFVMIAGATSLVSLGAVLGCGPSGARGPALSTAQEAIDRGNDPALVDGADGALLRGLAELPTSGATTGVWTGHWWPMAQGGTAARVNGGLSPLEKYDAVAANGNRAATWERQNSQSLATVSWAGHCNGLAAAGTMTAEPRHDVVYRGVTFTVTDVKALLTELWQGGGAAIGGRCDMSAPPRDAIGRIVNPACRNLNPGSFHAVLANFLGRWRKAVIIDRAPTVEVWNYPVTAFRSRVTPVTAAQAAQAVGLPGGTAYAFNPAARDFRHVTTDVTLVDGSVKTYAYVLELDATGQILGGEWVGASRQDHPDFIWRHTTPRPENPFIDAALVNAIHRLSL